VSNTTEPSRRPDHADLPGSTRYIPDDAVPDDDRDRHRTMSTHIFACSGCGQEIEVNGSMREAILSNGCPVCTEVAEPTNFERE